MKATKRDEDQAALLGVDLMERHMKLKFSVPDMECSNCAMHLEALEDTLPGVRRINASYLKLSMEVDFDEKQLTVEQIIQAAQEIGYHPQPKTD